jgi:hypothetical protein
MREVRRSLNGPPTRRFPTPLSICRHKREKRGAEARPVSPRHGYEQAFKSLDPEAPLALALVELDSGKAAAPKIGARHGGLNNTTLRHRAVGAAPGIACVFLKMCELLHIAGKFVGCRYRMRYTVLGFCDSAADVSEISSTAE